MTSREFAPVFFSYYSVQCELTPNYSPEEAAQLQGLRLLGRELDELDTLYAREDYT